MSLGAIEIVLQEVEFANVKMHESHQMAAPGCNGCIERLIGKVIQSLGGNGGGNGGGGKSSGGGSDP